MPKSHQRANDSESGISSFYESAGDSNMQLGLRITASGKASLGPGFPETPWVSLGRTAEVRCGSTHPIPGSTVTSEVTLPLFSYYKESFPRWQITCRQSDVCWAPAARWCCALGAMLLKFISTDTDGICHWETEYTNGQWSILAVLPVLFDLQFLHVKCGDNDRIYSMEFLWGWKS